MYFESNILFSQNNLHV